MSSKPANSLPELIRLRGGLSAATPAWAAISNHCRATSSKSCRAKAAPLLRSLLGLFVFPAILFGSRHARDFDYDFAEPLLLLSRCIVWVITCPHFAAFERQHVRVQPLRVGLGAKWALSSPHSFRTGECACCSQASAMHRRAGDFGGGNAPVVPYGMARKSLRDSE